MEALDRSDELMRRCSELRARSERMRAAADEKMDKSRRLIAAAVAAQEIMMHARGWEPGRARGGLFARAG